jgi:hypothetical protein
MNSDIISIIIIIIIPVYPLGRIRERDQCFFTKHLYAYSNSANHTTHAKKFASFI